MLFVVEQSHDSIPFMTELVKTQAFAQFTSDRILLPDTLSTASSQGSKPSDRTEADGMQGDVLNSIFGMYVYLVLYVFHLCLYVT